MLSIFAITGCQKLFPNVVANKATLSSDCGNSANSLLSNDGWLWCGGSSSLTWSFKQRVLLSALKVTSKNNEMVDSFKIEYQPDLLPGSTWTTLTAPNGKEFVSNS